MKLLVRSALISIFFLFELTGYANNYFRDVAVAQDSVIRNYKVSLNPSLSFAPAKFVSDASAEKEESYRIEVIHSFKKQIVFNSPCVVDNNAPGPTAFFSIFIRLFKGLNNCYSDLTCKLLL